MKFSVEYPVLTDEDGGAWLQPRNIVRFAQSVEAAGLDAISFTDHPAPSKKWLDAGGHATFDPFAALTFCAGVTDRLRLMTHLAVAPYRNPLLTARSMASVDVLSGGRATFVLGAGYLRSEFAALGVDFDERLALFDESVEVIKGAWSADSFSFEGRHFTAKDVCLRPSVVQTPHPPLWLGGNSTTMLDRVARWADGWSPLMGPAILSQTTRTRAISSLADLAESCGDLGRRLAENGRALADVDIQLTSETTNLGVPMSSLQRIDTLGEMAVLGVTWTGVGVAHGPFEAALEQIQAFGEAVAAKVKTT